MGRFLRRDPSRKLILSLYGFVDNDSVNYFDTDGMAKAGGSGSGSGGAVYATRTVITEFKVDLCCLFEHGKEEPEIVLPCLICAATAAIGMPDEKACSECMGALGGLSAMCLTINWENQKCVDAGAGTCNLAINNAPFDCQYDYGCGKSGGYKPTPAPGGVCPSTCSCATRKWVPK